MAIGLHAVVGQRKLQPQVVGVVLDEVGSDIDRLLVKSSYGEKKFDNISLGLSFSEFEKAMHAAVLLHSSQTLI